MPPKDRTKRRVIPKQPRARVSRDAILTAAELLLRESGFSRMTTNRIAARAGVNVALVYRYFAGKEAIVGALIDRVALATYEAVRTAIADNAGAPLPIAIRAVLDVLVATPSAPELHRELVEHVDVTKRRRLVQDLRAKVAASFAGLLAERRAELRALEDPDALVFVLQHAIEAATNAAAFYRPEGMSTDRVLDALTVLVTRTLLPVAASPKPAKRARQAHPSRTATR
jgi:AcrR family transcriptional regulator